MIHDLILFASDIPLGPAHIERLETFCEARGLLIAGEPQWIEPHKAARLAVDQCINMEQMKELRTALQGDRMDIFCVKQRKEPYKLLISDMDATMVTAETLDELAAQAGIGAQVAAITARAMNDELDFEAALRERVSLLKGMDEAALTDTLAHIKLSEGAKEFVQSLKKTGATCVLVSGGFTFFTGTIAARLGFDHHHGNALIINDGKLTGEVGTPILGKEAKLAYLKEYAQTLGCDLADTLAIGDGANDLPMLQAAGLGIAYRPKPVLADNLLNCLFFADLNQVYL
jgi:phosphoserine phosphatase